MAREGVENFIEYVSYVPPIINPATCSLAVLLCFADVLCFGFCYNVTYGFMLFVTPLQLLAKEPTTKDPKAVIEKNTAVRSNLRALEENWKQLDSAYQAEKSKRRVSVVRSYHT